MGRTFGHSVDLPDGARVGFGLTRRGRVYGVRFRDASGEWVERSTEEVQKGRAVDRARELIAEFFRTAEGPGAGWLEVARAIDGLAYLRPETRRSDRSNLDLLRTALPELTGPAAVDAEAAARFLCVSAAGTWKAGPNVAARPRTANTVRSTIRTLRALWSKHLRELGVVTRNPWADMTPPAGERRAPVSPDEGRVSEFLDWVKVEFPGGVLHTFFVLKAYCGSRLEGSPDRPVDSLQFVAFHRRPRVRLHPGLHPAAGSGVGLIDRTPPRLPPPLGRRGLTSPAAGPHTRRASATPAPGPVRAGP